METLYKYLKFAKIAASIAAITTLAVFLWPGAFAAVTSFSLFGFSIAALTPSLPLQIGALALVTFGALNLVGFAIDAISGLFNFMKWCCTPNTSTPKPTNNERPATAPEMRELPRYTSSHVPVMGRLVTEERSPQPGQPTTNAQYHDAPPAQGAYKSIYPPVYPGSHQPPAYSQGQYLPSAPPQASSLYPDVSTFGYQS